MRYAWQWLKSLVFILVMYLWMVVVAIVYLPWAIASPNGASAACHAYARSVMFLARVMLGLKSEIRGTPPTGEVMIAAKHQSFFDIILIYSAIPRGKFIMKRQLTRAPIFGWFTLRLGCVPVDRGKRGAAVRKMLEDVQSGRAIPGQLVIYPQGTRVAPGASVPYKIGTGALYRELGQPCVPVACNVGVFWPRHGILRKPGTAVVDFLPPIEPGMEVDAFMATLEDQIETRSNALMAEAGFQIEGPK